jgi:hypothetical protein
VKRGGVADAWADPKLKKAVAATDRPQLVMAAVTTDLYLFGDILAAELR